MSWPGDFHLLRPEWLLALLPLAGLTWYAIRRRRGSQGWKTVCDKALLPHVLTSPGGPGSLLPVWLGACAGTLAILAAAGPAWEKLPQPVFRDASAVVVALDLSQSMDATDIKPSRLARARLKLLDILQQRKTGQTALLVYAADAFVVAPLTDDTETIAHLVPTLETAIMPAQGSKTLTAIRMANDLLRQAGITSGLILLVTDGISEVHAAQVGDVMDSGHRLGILGIGTVQGGPIPLTGGFLTDRDGSIVIPGLDAGTLRRAAAAGAGSYRGMRNDDSDITELLALIDGDVDTGDDSLDRTADTWREEGPWLLLLVIPLAALLARRGWLAVMLLGVLPYSEPAHALEWQDLWRTPDQQAMQALEGGDAPGAAGIFEDPDWKAAAQYRAGRYRDAIESMPEPASSDDFYNRGNALAKLGQLEQALADYDQALELDPDNEDAAFNRQLVEDAIEQMRQQSQQQPSSDSGENGEHDESEQQAGGGENSEQQQPSQDSPAGDEQRQQAGETGSDQPAARQSDQQAAQQDQAPRDETGPSQQDGQATRGEEQLERQELDAAEADKQQQEAARQSGSRPEQEAGELDEQARATEQWLQRIPDDPGGLLRRKFQYQYKQRGRQSQSTQPW